MDGLLTMMLVMAGYLLLQYVVLPRLGVPT